MLPTNAAALQQRWPALYAQLRATPLPDQQQLLTQTPACCLVVNNLQLASAYAPVAEADLQVRALPEQASTVHLYGIGTGELPRAARRRCPQARLRVAILAPQAFVLVMTHFDCSDWLADPRCELELADPDSAPCAPLAVAPAALRLVAAPLEPLRDRLRLELNTRIKSRRRLAQEAEWRERLQANAAQIDHDPPVSELLREPDHRPSIVTAAGPSLAEHYDWIREVRASHRLVSVNTALKPLLAAGLVPDVVVVIDSDEAGIARHFETDLSACADCALVYYPIVWPRVLSVWPGPRYWAISHSAVFDELRAQAGPSELFTAGTVLHTAVDFAVRGGSPVVHLLGADLSFPDDQRHVAGVVEPPAGEQPAAQSVTVRNADGQAVRTEAAFVGFLRDLETYIAGHPEIDFIQHGRRGARIAGTRLWEAET